MTEECRFEREVVRAISDDRWTDALRRHVLECESCAAAAAVAPWMDQLAHAEQRDRPLPDPAVLWLKAKLLAGTAAVERAARPMNIFNYLAYAAVAAAWAGLLTWKWSALQHWLLGFKPSNVIQSAAMGPSLPMTFFIAVLLLSSLTIGVAMHTILADE